MKRPKKSKSRSDITNKRRLIASIIVIGVVLVGLHHFVGSHATGPYTSAKADSGTVVSPAAKQTCTGSSDGNCVKFGTVATGGAGINPTPTGPATPSGGWSVAMADDFNTPIGTGAGQDNLWYPSQNWSGATTDADGNNGYETEVYNSSQVSVSGGNLVLTAQYQNDRAPCTGDCSGNDDNDRTQRNYVSGMVTSPTGGIQSGVKGFSWLPGGGQTWAFEIDCQFPSTADGNLFNAFWTSTQSGWTDERDFFEGHDQTGSIDSDWIYVTNSQQDYYATTLGFNPSTAMHRYTYVIYPNQSWSLYIDGVLQTWVNGNGIAPARTSVNDQMQILINYALDQTTFTGSRAFTINSVAAYEDTAAGGSGVTGGGLAPGTVIN